MSTKNTNKLNVPQARAAMDKFKMEAASEEDVYPPQKAPAAPTVSSRSLFACTWRRPVSYTHLTLSTIYSV